MKSLSTITLAMAVLVAVPAAAAAGFVPHRAVYAFSLDSSKPGSGIASVDGDMAADWDQSCEGWTLNQKSVLNLYAPDGSRRLSLSSVIATWESADGRAYSFNVRNQTDDQEPELIEGKARMPSAKAPGWVDFASPRRGRLRLPAGTVFPTRHTIVVLDALPRAPTTVSKLVFDGITLDGLHEVNAVIGRPRPAPTDISARADRLSWPVHLAFFGVGSAEPEPNHEIGIRLFDDGIGEDMVLDFDDFAVRARLTRLEVGKPKACP